MVRYLFYTIGDLTYQSPLVSYNISFHVNLDLRGYLPHLGFLTKLLRI